MDMDLDITPIRNLSSIWYNWRARRWFESRSTLTFEYDQQYFPDKQVNSHFE